MALPDSIPKPIRWIINRLDNSIDRTKEWLDFKVINFVWFCYQIRIYCDNMPEWDRDNYTHLKRISCLDKNEYEGIYKIVRIERKNSSNNEIDWERILR